MDMMEAGPPALTALSSPTEIYTVCTTYQELTRHKQHAPVRALIRAITSYRHKHRELNTAELAFNQHRAATLDGTIHARPRQRAAAPRCAMCLTKAADLRLLPCRHDAFCGRC